MKKYMFTIILSLAVGFLLANFMLRQYSKDLPILPAFGRSEIVYLIQQGVYSSAQSMNYNTQNLSHFIYSLIDEMYYVYIGMTLEENNAKKLQEYYDNLGIDTIIKTTTISDNDFIEQLRHYDLILMSTTDNEVIREVIKQVLSKYEGD